MKSGRIPELDGVRALALLPVLYVHSNVIHHDHLGLVAAYGWIGVDLFFVLSGFLITGILLDTKGTEKYFLNFYARRILRIWPVYFALLFAVLVVVPHFHPAAHNLLKFSAWYYVLFLQNLFRFPDYVPALGPTWSLGVEEQFYLLWPLLIAILPRRKLPWLIALALVAAPIVRFAVFHFTRDWLFVYVLTFCRADGLLVGAGLAYWVRSDGYSEARLFALGRWAIGLTLVPILWIFSRSISARGQESVLTYSFLALAFGGLICLALTPRSTMFRRLLRLPVLQYVGKISYGLYVIHKPIYMLFENTTLYSVMQAPGTLWLNTIITFIAEVSLAILVASLSWYFFESPVLRLKRYFEGPRSAPAMLAASAN